MSAPARSWSNLPLAIVAYAILFFLIAPLLIVVPVSLTGGELSRFPPDGLSLRWYRDFFQDHEWMEALWLSFSLGISVAVLSTAVGLGAALALARFMPNALKPVIRVLVLTPMIVPGVVGAIAMFLILSQAGLVSTFTGLLLAHTVLALPYSVIVIENALLHLDPALDEAARTLGASNTVRMRRITLPMIAPSLVGSAVFAFITSFDEIVVVLLVGGARSQTLPVKMFNFLENELRPTPAVVSSLLILALILGQLAARLVRRQIERRRGLAGGQIAEA
ncbi:ABC transporter permease [Bosea sp. NPDC055594]